MRTRGSLGGRRRKELEADVPEKTRRREKSKELQSTAKLINLTMELRARLHFCYFRTDRDTLNPILWDAICNNTMEKFKNWSFTDSTGYLHESKSMEKRHDRQMMLC